MFILNWPKKFYLTDYNNLIFKNQSDFIRIFLISVASFISQKSYWQFIRSYFFKYDYHNVSVVYPKLLHYLPDQIIIASFVKLSFSYIRCSKIVSLLHNN